MHMAQDPDNDDGTFTNVDKYFNEHGYSDEFLGPPSQEPNPAKYDRDLAGTAEKPNWNRSSGVQFSKDASSCRIHRASDSRGAKYYQPQHTQEGCL